MASSRKPVLLSVPALILVSSVALAATEESTPVQPLVGQSAPEFTLASLEHGKVSLSDFRTKTVVLHFGTGW